MSRKVTVPLLREKKRKGEKITMITAYDYLSGKLADEAGFDIVLVGDSLGMVIKGESSTLSVTVEEMLYHTRITRRGVQRALLVADMPFLSYQVSEAEAIRNCGRMLKEGGAEAVKLEGGAWLAPLVERLVRAGIPVMGHLGLTPQSIHLLGGYRVQARTEEAAQELKRSAQALQEAGIFALVLEGVPAEVAREVTESLDIPTIGIGAGPYCDGQVLVFHDVLGLFEEFKPKFVKRYLEGARLMREALIRFREEIQQGVFPGEEHTYS